MKPFLPRASSFVRQSQPPRFRTASPPAVPPTSTRPAPLPRCEAERNEKSCPVWPHVAMCDQWCSYPFTQSCPRELWSESFHLSRELLLVRWRKKAILDERTDERWIVLCVLNLPCQNQSTAKTEWTLLRQVICRLANWKARSGGPHFLLYHDYLAKQQEHTHSQGKQDKQELQEVTPIQPSPSVGMLGNKIFAVWERERHPILFVTCTYITSNCVRNIAHLPSDSLMSI